MRGDVLLRLRMAARPRGLAGVAGAVAGLSGMASAYLPWYRVSADVAMLGSAQSRAVAALAGWQAHPWSWLVPALSLVAVVVGVRVAVDQPLPYTRDLTVAAGLGLGAIAAIGGLSFPPVSRFDVAGSRLRELAELADRLPSDVELTFTVRPAVGLWLAVVVAAWMVVLGVLTRDLR